MPSMNTVSIGSRQSWAVFSEKVDPEGNIVLRILGQPVPPLSKFVR